MATAYINQERFGVEFEDRINKLLNIDPEETPFESMVQKSEAERNRVDWQTTTLAAANADNAGVDGADVTNAAANYVLPSGLYNYTQIPQKPFAASFSVDAVRKPGIGKGDKSAFNNEKAKKIIELKRDIEASLISNNDRTQPLPESTQAGKLRGVQKWITSNVVTATDVKYGGAILSRQMVDDVNQKAVDNGGRPEVLMMNSFNRIQLNNFAGPISRDVDSQGRKIQTMIDVIESIAGKQEVHFNRYLTASVLLALEMQYWEQRWLRAPQSYIKGLTGSRTEGWIEAESTLVCWAEKASGKITGLATA